MKWANRIVDFIFPRVCHLCGEPLGAGLQYLCPSCLARLPRSLYHRVAGNSMEKRFMGQFPFRAATGHFFYSRDSEIAGLIHDFKYRHFRGLAVYLGEVIGKELYSTGFLSDIDVILPVPMHFLKKARRGYNQTDQLAAGLSKITGIPVGKNLQALRSHRTQTSMSHEQRIANTQNLFGVKNPEELRHKSILILDDVCTTGATLSSAASTVACAVPDVEISLLTLAVTF